MKTHLVFSGGAEDPVAPPRTPLLRRLPTGPCRLLLVGAAGLSLVGLLLVISGVFSSTAEEPAPLPQAPALKPPEERPLAQTEEGGLAAAELVKQTEMLGEGLRQAVLAEIRQHPRQDRWAGQLNARLFAVAARPLPRGASRQRAIPLTLTAAQIIAFHEVLTAKSLLDAYVETGLTDVAAVRQAVLQAQRELHVAGKGKAVLDVAKVQGDYAAAVVVAEEAALKAQLLQPTELAKVRTAYGQVKHAQMITLMKASQWDQALAVWQHLRERQLVSPDLYLDAAQCLKKLARPEEALALLEDALERFAAAAPAGWLERCGDQALELGRTGENLARRAYEKETERLLKTPTGARAP